MLKKHLKNKRLISFIFLFLFIFNIVTDFKRQEVNANALAGVIGGMMLEGSGAAAAGAIVAAGPYVAAFAVICIGAGIVYQNKDEIQAGLLNAYNYAKLQGKNLMDYFTTDANGNVSVKGEGINLIKGSVKSYLADPTVVNGLIGEYSIGTGTSTKPSIVNVSLPTANEEDLIILNLKGSSIAEAGYRPSVDFLINGNKVTGIGGTIFNSSYADGIFLALAYDLTGWKFWYSINGLDSLKKSISTQVNGNYRGNSICSDFSIKASQSNSVSANFSLSRILGNSVGNTESVDSEVTFRNPALEADKDVSVSVPVDTTWDRVIGKTYDETLDATTGDKTIPGEGEGTGIWDWLKNLLNSILDAIKSIPGAIISFLSSILDAIKAIPNAILSFFIIDWSLISEHIVYDEIFKDKFKPFYDVVYLLQNINANPQTHSGKFYMVIPKEMGGDGKEHVVLDLTVGYDYISMARSFINASIWLSFLWYIIKLFSPKLDIS